MERTRKKKDRKKERKKNTRIQTKIQIEGGEARFGKRQIDRNKKQIVRERKTDKTERMEVREIERNRKRDGY